MHSTLLVESGHAPRQFVRAPLRANFASDFNQSVAKLSMDIM